MYCNECGNELKSDKAEICPACGCRIKAKPSSTMIVGGYALAVLFPIGGFIVGVVNLCRGELAHGTLQILLSVATVCVCVAGMGA